MTEVTSQRGQVLLSYTAPYYLSSNLYKSLRQAQGKEFDDLLQTIRETLNQFYVETATWDLPRWEYETGIITRQSDSIDIRRGRILAKLQAPPGPFNRAAAIALANAYSKAKTADAYTLEANKRYITLHDVNDLIDLQGMIDAFSEMAPAHLRHVVGLGTVIHTNMELAFSNNMLILVNPMPWLNNDKDKILDGSWALDGSKIMDRARASPMPIWIDTETIVTAATQEVKRQNKLFGMILDGGRKLDNNWNLAGTTTILDLIKFSLMQTNKRAYNMTPQLQGTVKPTINRGADITSAPILNGYWNLNGSQNMSGLKNIPMELNNARTVDIKRQTAHTGPLLDGGRKLDNTWNLTGTTTSSRLIRVVSGLNNKMAALPFNSTRQHAIGATVAPTATLGTGQVLNGTWKLDNSKILSGIARIAVTCNGVAV